MQFLSFRNRRVLRRVLLSLLLVLLVLVLLCAATLLYLQRYLVYTKDGVHFDFSAPQVQIQPPQTGAQYDFPAGPVAELMPEDTTPEQAEQALRGYIVPAQALDDTDALLAACDALDAPCTLLLDAKDGFGNFFYTSDISGQGDGSGNVLDALVPALKSRGFYLVARISAFRDRTFALEDTSLGLPLESGALWMDESGCYWLDPASDTVRIRLIRIATELFELGFDEVLFTDFCFPDSENIVYVTEQTTDTLLAEAASLIGGALTEDGRVSFVVTTEQAGFDPVGGRLYCQTDDVSAVQTLLGSFGPYLADPATQLVFLTDSRDTRFSEYGLLRSDLIG